MAVELVTLRTNQGEYQFDVLTRFDETVALSDKALQCLDRWMSFKVKVNRADGIVAIKKFQIKVVHNERTGKTEVTIRRNNLASKIRRFFSFLGVNSEKLSAEDAKCKSCFANILTRYTCTRRSLLADNIQRAADRHFLNSEQLAKAATAIQNQGGNSVTLAPSNVLNSLVPGEQENIAIVLDLHDTLYTQTDSNNGSSVDNMISLDPVLPEVISCLKRQNNIRLIIFDMSSAIEDRRVAENLSRLGYDLESIDCWVLKGSVCSIDSSNKEEKLLGAIRELKESQNWEPTKVIHFNDDSAELALSKGACSQERFDYQGYQVLAAKYFRECQDRFNADAKEGASELAAQFNELKVENLSANELTASTPPQNLSQNRQKYHRKDVTEFQLTARELVDGSSAEIRHYYYMLRG